MSNWQYRICEETRNGKTLYYPERKKLLGWARVNEYNHYTFLNVDICFGSIDEAYNYINEKIIETADDIITKKYHNIS
jgi:hypothetical protein